MQRINYPHPTDPGKTFVMEDGSLPPMVELVDWLLGNVISQVSPWRKFWQGLKDGLSASQGQNAGAAAVLMVGKDKSDGTFYLDPLKGALRLDWSYWSSHELHEMMSAKLEQSRQVVGGTLAIPFPTYPLLRNLTAHPLGGCKLGTASANSVTDANRDSFGRVHNYNNLYVADGALVPSSIGANPSLTIGALAEMVAEGITRVAPHLDAVGLLEADCARFDAVRTDQGGDSVHGRCWLERSPEPKKCSGIPNRTASLVSTADAAHRLHRLARAFTPARSLPTAERST